MLAQLTVAQTWFVAVSPVIVADPVPSGSPGIPLAVWAAPLSDTDHEYVVASAALAVSSPAASTPAVAPTQMARRPLMRRIAPPPPLVWTPALGRRIVSSAGHGL